MTKTLTPDATHRIVSLSDLAWCDDHRQDLERKGVDETWATLDIAQRATEGDYWDRVVVQPADAELRIDFEDTPEDPTVHVEHDGSGDLEVTPLCCAVSRDARLTTYALAQMAADDDA